MSKTVAEVASQAQNPSEEEEEEQFLDTVSLNTITDKNATVWSTTITVAGQQVAFKVDTGAEVTALSETSWKSMGARPVLQKAKRVLCGPDRQPLKVVGEMTVKLSLKAKSCTHTVYVVRGLQNNLLGLPAVRDLGLIQNIESVNDDITSQYPELFTGLGTFKEEYKIQLKPDAQPFALHTSRNVPLTMKKKVEKELECMEQLGVVSKVSEPTEWYAGMVVVPKPSGGVRICKTPECKCFARVPPFTKG